MTTNSPMDAAVARIWARSADLIRARVEAVEAAATALLENKLTSEQRAAAVSAAHALVGSAGSFGFARASTVAREAELMLKGDEAVPPGSVLRLATIAVELRRDLIDAPQPQAISGNAPAVAETVAKVVAVDDDLAVLDLLTASLGARGIAVHAINDSTAAADTIASRRPDLVILDVDMPGIDGISLCKRLRTEPRTAAVPIVFLTSHTDAATVSALFAAGADDHVAKPVNIEELSGRITNRLLRADQMRRALTPVSAPVLTPAPGKTRDYTTDIAIVDDDAVLTSLLQHAFDARGYSCTTIGEGTAAVAKLCGADSPVVPRVILLDVSLPGLDGLAVLRALSRDGVPSRSRIIMLTARSLESEVLQALEAGAHDHMAKPFSVPVLMQRLRRIFESDTTKR